MNFTEHITGRSNEKGGNVMLKRKHLAAVSIVISAVSIAISLSLIYLYARAPAVNGESYTHSFVFNTAETQEWTIPVVPTRPKRFSVWVDITTMNEGDTITVTLMIDREGTGNYYIYWDGSAYSTWEWTADADTRFHWLVDQLSISNNWRVKVQISYTPVAPAVTITCGAIIEEV